MTENIESSGRSVAIENGVSSCLQPSTSGRPPGRPPAGGHLGGRREKAVEGGVRMGNNAHEAPKDPGEGLVPEKDKPQDLKKSEEAPHGERSEESEATRI